MKIQTIILICIISIYQEVGGSGMSNGGRLSTKENEDRLRTCGKEFPLRPSEGANGADFDYDNNPSWLLWVTWTDHNGTWFNRSAAFPISQRYVFTSSQVVLTGDRRWTVDEKPVDNDACEKNKYVDLPPNVVNSLRVVSGNKKYVKVLRGRAFTVCGITDFNLMFSPLLLEVEGLPSTASTNIPCLADDSIPADISGEVHAYGFDKLVMKHHKLFIKEYIEDRWVYTNLYKVGNDRGGPLVMDYNGKVTVIALKAHDPVDESVGVYFYSMMKLYNEICKYSGVCKALPNTTTTTTTTTKAPTTPEPSTTTPDPSKTTNPKSSTTKSLEPSTKAPKPSTPPGEPTQKPEKGRDSEEETDDSSDGFEGDVEYVDEEDEVGVPVFFGIDEWNGSGRKKMELNFFVLFVFVMVLGV